jgi:hypothetical protein
MWDISEGLQSAESKPVAPNLMGSAGVNQPDASKVQPGADVSWEALPEPWVRDDFTSKKYVRVSKQVN